MTWPELENYRTWQRIHAFHSSSSVIKPHRLSSTHGVKHGANYFCSGLIEGGGDWRPDLNPLSLKPLSLLLNNLVGLYCIVPRDHYGEVYDSILRVLELVQILYMLTLCLLNNSKMKNGHLGRLQRT